MGMISNFFKKELKKEEKKILGRYSGEYTKDELRQKAANSILKKSMLKGGIALSCVVAGITGFSFANNSEKEVNTQNNIISETSNLVKKDNIDNNKEDILEEIDDISTKEQALEFIKKIYVDEYNKVNNTKYGVDDVYFNSGFSQDYVFELDGTYITHGQTPDSVRNKLDNENKEYEIKHDIKIYSSYVEENGNKKILEKFAVNNAKVVDVIFADEYLNNIQNIENENTLLKMNKVIIKGIDLAIDLNNGKRESDIILRKNDLENTLSSYLEENLEKNVVLDEIGGR